MKRKTIKGIQKLKTKPLENSHTSVNDEGSTVRGPWKVNGHFTGALSTVSNTDRLNAFNPPTVIWIELTPALPTSPGQRRLILPAHSSVCLTPASCKTTAVCRKCWVFCRGQRRARSCMASLVPLSSFWGLHWERDYRELFLSYQKNWELHSMPGWQKNHQALVSAPLDSCPVDSHLYTCCLTQTYRLLCIKLLKFGAMSTKA